MQSRIKNQNPNLKPKPNQSKHPLKKNPKFIGLGKKKFLLLENQIGKRLVFNEWVWGLGFCGGVG